MEIASTNRAALLHWLCLIASLFLIAAITTGQLRAQTLTEVFVATYQNNPGLQSQRFQTRGVDESVPEALSGYRPKIVGDVFYGVTSHNATKWNSNAISDRSYGYGAQIEQPLFDGFRTRNRVSEAEAEVSASHQNLRARESEVLFQAATSYFDVLRNEGVVLYRRKNLTALRRELVGARERLGRGQSTMTAVEQTKQRMALARSDLEAASAQLRISRIKFARVTGLKPRKLRMPRLPRALWPRTLRGAIETAENSSPIIRAAHSKHRAARHAIAKVRGELLPEATLVGSFDRSFDASTDILDESSASIVGRLRVPLYQGGAVSARVRRAHNVAASRDRDMRDAKLRVGEAVGAAWTELGAARRRLIIEKDAVVAGERALDAVREEQRAGQRTLLDILDAERELVNARIRLLTTRRDLHVSTFALLRSTGELTIARLAPGTEQYDPKQHYHAVRGKWWGTKSPVAGGSNFLGNAHREERGQGTRQDPKVAARSWRTQVKMDRR